MAGDSKPFFSSRASRVLEQQSKSLHGTIIVPSASSPYIKPQPAHKLHKMVSEETNKNVNPSAYLQPP